MDEPEEVRVVHIPEDHVGDGVLRQDETGAVILDRRPPPDVDVARNRSTALPEPPVDLAHLRQLAEPLAESEALPLMGEGAVEIRLVVEIPAELEVDLRESGKIRKPLGDCPDLFEDAPSLRVPATDPHHVDVAEPKIDPLSLTFLGAGKLLETRNDRVVVARRLFRRETGGRLLCGTREVGEGLLGVPALLVVIREEFGFLVEPGRENSFQHSGDSFVIAAPPLRRETPVSDLLRKGVLERVLEIRENLRLVEELGGLEILEPPPQRLLGLLDERLEEGERHVLPDHGGALEYALFLGREPVDPCGEDRLRRRRNLEALRRLRELVRAALSPEHLGLDQGPHALFEEEGIPFRPFDQEPLQRGERRVAAEQCVEQDLGALGRQRVDAELPVVRLAPPAGLVLGTIVDEEEDAGSRQALDETVEGGLGLRVDPMQILEKEQERLLLALAEQHTFDTVQDPLAAMRRVQALPRGIFGGDVQERQERREERFERSIEGEDFPCHLLADPPRLVTALDLQVRFQEIDNREIRAGFAVGNRVRFCDQPPLGAMRVRELPVEA